MLDAKARYELGMACVIGEAIASFDKDQHTYILIKCLIDNTAKEIVVISPNSEVCSFWGESEELAAAYQDAAHSIDPIMTIRTGLKPSNIH